MYLRAAAAALGVIGCSTLAVFATEPVDTYQELVKCGAIQDPGTRLACYDSLMPRVRAALAAGPAELSREDQTSLFGLDFSGIFGSSEATTPQQFGADNLPQPETSPTGVRPIEEIQATLTDYAMTPLGKFIVFLDNGQVWRQQQADTGTAHFKSPASANTVVISKAMLGSYSLQLNGSNKSFKVNRVK
jgi:hypothetical protein